MRCRFSVAQALFIIKPAQLTPQGYWAARAHPLLNYVFLNLCQAAGFELLEQVLRSAARTGPRCELLVTVLAVLAVIKLLCRLSQSACRALLFETGAACAHLCVPMASAPSLNIFAKPLLMLSTTSDGSLFSLHS